MRISVTVDDLTAEATDEDDDEKFTDERVGALVRSIGMGLVQVYEAAVIAENATLPTGNADPE